MSDIEAGPSPMTSARFGFDMVPVSNAAERIRRRKREMRGGEKKG